MGELSGRVALVTGGGRGIGRAVAQAFADAGAAVAVAARSRDQINETAALIQHAGGQAHAAQADVSNPASVRELLAETERQLGPVDVLVNNAGVGGPLGPLWENDPDEWWRCQEANVRGAVLCAHAVLPGMIARGNGRILNVVSAAGTFAVPYASAYLTAKTALVRLSEALALETQEHGVSVFAVDPGLVRTTMTETLYGSADGRRWLPGYIERVEALSPPPDAATALCLRLASGEADALSGRLLGVRDDIAELARRADEIRTGDLYTLRLRT